MENYSWGPGKSWIFLSVKEWEPWIGHNVLIRAAVVEGVRRGCGGGCVCVCVIE